MFDNVQHEELLLRLEQHGPLNPSELAQACALLPSKWQRTLGLLFLVRPQLKSKIALLAHLYAWRGTGTDEVEELTHADLDWMVKQILQPKYVQRHNFGEAFGQIMADLASLFEERRAQKRRQREARAAAQDRAAEQNFLTQQNLTEVQQLTKDLARNFANHSRRL